MKTAAVVLTAVVVCVAVINAGPILHTPCDTAAKVMSNDVCAYCNQPITGVQ